MSLIYIIDEDEDAALYLQSQLNIMSNAVQTEIFKDTSQAYMALVEREPAIVFINFDIPLIKGGNLYSEMLQLSIPFVCVTSVPNAYMTAVSLHAFDYLSKPFQLSRLEETIRKFFLYIESRLKETPPEPVAFHEILLRQKDKIMVNTTEFISLIPIESILKIEGINNYSRIHTHDGNILMTSKTLKYFEIQLNPYAFIRVHKSHLVNLIFIDRLLNRGGTQILMKTGEVIEITKEKRTEIKQWFRI